MVGSTRSFGYDAAATFANFIATPSLWDAFAVRSVIPTIPVTQVATNDHVLLSLLSHVIYSLSGSRSEVVYRVLPALAAAGTVGLSTAVLSRRFGLLAGICAGIFIATDPLFVDNSRDLRGYSLAALGCVTGTVLVVGPWSRKKLALYAVVMGLAIAAQLFAAVVLACHAAWLLRRWRQLLPAWLVAAAIGVAANASIYYLELTRHGLPPPLFYPTFPRDLLLFLVGAPVLLPVGLWLAVALLGVWVLRRHVWLWTTAAVVVAAVLVLWLAIQPAFLYPRFFVFLVPAVGFLMAAAIQRWWVLAPVVLIGAAAAAYGQSTDYMKDPLALPQAAAVVEQVHASGGRACVIHSDEQVLAAYTTEFTVVTNADQLAGCDAVVVVSWGVDLPLRDEAARQFPNLRTLDAYYPAVVLER
jgi:MFS family permease